MEDFSTEWLLAPDILVLAFSPSSTYIWFWILYEVLILWFNLLPWNFMSWCWGISTVGIRILRSHSSPAGLILLSQSLPWMTWTDMTKYLFRLLHATLHYKRGNKIEGSQSGNIHLKCLTFVSFKNIWPAEHIVRTKKVKH